MIYFAQMDCPDGFIKIGIAIDLRQRIDKLQNASPYEIGVVRVLAGGIAEERALHARFAASKVRREWFRPTDDLIAYIRETEPKCLGRDAPREETGTHRGSVYRRLALHELARDESRRRFAEVRRTRVLERSNLKQVQ